MDIKFWKKGNKKSDEKTNQGVHEQKTTILGKNLKIKANIKGDDHIQMMCAYTGEVELNGEIEIGRPANISGTIRADKITVGGRVKGSLSAQDSLYILDAAIIKGDLKTTSIIFDKGARFNGKIDMNAAAGNKNNR